MIDYLASHPGSSTVDDAAHFLRVSPARARSVLETLAERGYARKGRCPGHYRLTIKLAKLGLAYQAHSTTSDIVQVILDRLAIQTGELVRLALAEGDRLIWVARAQGSRSGLRFDAETGRDVALASTAGGKAWLAGFPSERAVKLVLAQGFAGKNEFGPRAIRSVERLTRELQTTAERGYATGHDEYMLGISAIAAAIRGQSPTDAPLGAVSIAGPSTRLTSEKLESFRNALLEAIGELSALQPVLSDSSSELIRRATR